MTSSTSNPLARPDAALLLGARGTNIHAAAWVWFAALVLPWSIGLSFSHPTPRVVVPESLMLLVVVVVTFVGGWAPGATAAVSSMVALWTLSFPPGITFRLSSGYDVVAVVASGGIATLMALIVTWLRDAERSAVVRTQAVEVERHRDRELITELQEAILPAAPSYVERMSFACAYRSGGGLDEAVGGDWYAFIPLDDGRVGIAIGDVAGHGVEAISVMAEYRFTLRTLAASGESPEIVLNRLESLSRRLRRTDAFTTCVYGVVDPNTGTGTFANAGHMPPLLVRGGVVETLELPIGPPIGAVAHIPCYAAQTIRLQRGDTLMLYTDGLVERRDEVLDVGIDRLCRRAADITGSLAFDASRIVDDMVGDKPRDDAALVIARFDTLV